MTKNVRQVFYPCGAFMSGSGGQEKANLKVQHALGPRGIKKGDSINSSLWVSKNCLFRCLGKGHRERRHKTVRPPVIKNSGWQLQRRAASVPRRLVLLRRRPLTC